MAGGECLAMSKGRKPGFSMGEEHRVKIRNSNILNALIEHVEGRREMSSSQVSAGLGLLKKVMPDLAQVENKTEVTHRYVARVPEKATSPQKWQQQHAPQATQH